MIIFNFKPLVKCYWTPQLPNSAVSLKWSMPPLLKNVWHAAESAAFEERRRCRIFCDLLVFSQPMFEQIIVNRVVHPIFTHSV